jgi:hypothetical protein
MVVCGSDTVFRFSQGVVASASTRNAELVSMKHLV